AANPAAGKKWQCIGADFHTGAPYAGRLAESPGLATRKKQWPFFVQIDRISPHQADYTRPEYHPQHRKVSEVSVMRQKKIHQLRRLNSDYFTTESIRPIL